MEQEIRNLIEKNYKLAKIKSVKKFGDIIVIRGDFNRVVIMSYIALRILNKYPEIHSVRFTGGWTEHFYSRETLKWGGFKVKEHKK